LPLDRPAAGLPPHGGLVARAHSPTDTTVPPIIAAHVIMYRIFARLPPQLRRTPTVAPRQHHSSTPLRARDYCARATIARRRKAAAHARISLRGSGAPSPNLAGCRGSGDGDGARSGKRRSVRLGATNWPAGRSKPRRNRGGLEGEGLPALPPGASRCVGTTDAPAAKDAARAESSRLRRPHPRPPHPATAGTRSPERAPCPCRASRR